MGINLFEKLIAFTIRAILSGSERCIYITMKNVRMGLDDRLGSSYMHLRNVADLLPFRAVFQSNLCLQLWTAAHDMEPLQGEGQVWK